MNHFATAVIILQILAALKYLYDNNRADALIWAMYAAINIVLVFRERINDAVSRP